MSRKTTADVNVDKALAAHEARVAAVEDRLKDPKRLAKVAADEQEQARRSLLRQGRAREELTADLAHLSGLPPDERCQATLQACEKNLSAQLASENEIIGAAYLDGGLSEYQEALFSEPMSVWHFGLIIKVHGRSNDEAWLRHKKAMIFLRDAARLAIKEDPADEEQSAAKRVFLNGCETLSCLEDGKIHPAFQSAPISSKIIRGKAAICWFAKSSIRQALLPTFCEIQRTQLSSAEAELSPSSKLLRSPARSVKTNKWVDTLLHLYPNGRPSDLYVSEMLRAVAKHICPQTAPPRRTFERAVEKAWKE